MRRVILYELRNIKRVYDIMDLLLLHILLIQVFSLSSFIHAFDEFPDFYSRRLFQLHLHVLYWKKLFIRQPANGHLSRGCIDSNELDQYHRGPAHVDSQLTKYLKSVFPCIRISVPARNQVNYRLISPAHLASASTYRLLSIPLNHWPYLIPQVPPQTATF